MPGPLALRYLIPETYGGDGADALSALVRAARRSGSVEVNSRDRIADNGRIFDFELTGEDLAQLDALDRTGNALDTKWW